MFKPYKQQAESVVSLDAPDSCSNVMSIADIISNWTEGKMLFTLINNSPTGGESTAE